MTWKGENCNAFAYITNSNIVTNLLTRRGKNVCKYIQVSNYLNVLVSKRYFVNHILQEVLQCNSDEPAILIHSHKVKTIWNISNCFLSNSYVPHHVIIYSFQSVLVLFQNGSWRTFQIQRSLTSTCHCFPRALTTRPSMGLRHAPQMGIPILSWQGRQYSSPFSSRASAVNSFLKTQMCPWSKNTKWSSLEPEMISWKTKLES